jgi:hypothetical protein
MENRTNKIRFGILCSGLVFPRWQAETIRQLLSEEFVQPALLVLEERPEKPGSLSWWQALKGIPTNRLFWSIYRNFYVNKRSRAGQPEDLHPLLEEVPVIHCRMVTNGTHSGYFEENDVDHIKSLELDFLIRFGFESLRGDILSAARYGVWSFHHGDEQKYRGTPPCFWEIYHGDPVSGAVLQRLTHRPDGGIALKRGFLKTRNSYVKNLDQLLFESAKWPVKICKAIKNGQLPGLVEAPADSRAPQFHAPTNIQLLQFFARALLLQLRKVYKSLFFTDYWNIGVARGNIQSFLDPENLPPVDWFPNLPRSKFLADPFGIYHQRKLHILYEEFPYREGIGKIGTLQFQDGGFSDGGIRIEEKFHLSYPFIFEYEKEIYCIPESYQARQVRLYKAVEFPDKWTFDRVLIDDYAGVDSTLFYHENLWWLFSTDKWDGVHHNLKIFYAADLFGPWQAHPQNPVKTDIRSARPAGTLFRQNGSIFRPSMDYSEKVEGRIVINKILELSTTRFEEEAYCMVDPYPDTPFRDKIHTLCAAGNYTIVDGAREMFVGSHPAAFRYKLKSLYKKLMKLID